MRDLKLAAKVQKKTHLYVYFLTENVHRGAFLLY